MKKNKFLLLLTLILMFTFSIIAIAHSGKTDSSGGHYDHSTGEYHYHHGYPAHEHTNGRCPYLYDDNTDYNSFSSSSSFGKIDFKALIGASFFSLGISLIPCWLIVGGIDMLLSKFNIKITSNMLLYIFLSILVVSIVVISILMLDI